MAAVDGFYYLGMIGNIVQSQCKLVRYRETLFFRSNSNVGDWNRFSR